MRTNVYIDEGTRDAMREMPRRMSASKLLRWLMKAVNTTDKEWKELIRKDGEIKEVQDYIRPTLRRALGLKDGEDK